MPSSTAILELASVLMGHRLPLANSSNKAWTKYLTLVTAALSHWYDFIIYSYNLVDKSKTKLAHPVFSFLEIFISLVDQFLL